MQKVSLYKSGKLRFIATLLCILWASLIFSMSAEVAEDSANRSGEIVEMVVPLIVEDFEEKDPLTQLEIIEFAENITRKTAHFCIFSVFGVLVLLASLGFERTWKIHLSNSVFIGFLYAISDEVHQHFVPGRAPMIRDVVIDTLGVICGVMALLLVVKFVLKRKNRRKI